MFVSQRIRQACRYATLLFAGLLIIVPSGYAQGDLSDVEILTVPVQGNIHLMYGAGSNTTVQSGREGLIIVDTQPAPLADKLFDTASQLSDGPLRYVINTHMHPENIGGNARLRELAPGSSFFGSRLEPFMNISHLNAYVRLVQLEREDPDAVPEGGLPVDSFDTDTFDFYFNDEALILYHVPTAHTDGDIIVHFRGSDVISAGGVYEPHGYPFIDIENGGNVQGIIDALNLILFLAVPAKHQEGGTLIVPGNGRIGDEADVVEYRDMVQIIADRIQDMIDSGMSLREIRRARPTLDYDTEYVNEDSSVSTDDFVEAVYQSLAGN